MGNYERKTCRMCGGGLNLQLELKPTPIANKFQKEPMKGEFYPLDLMQCKVCSHVQNRHVLVDLYKDYKYKTPKEQVSALNTTSEYLKKLYPEAKKVVEIGSNIGLNVYALGEFFDQVIGVDPAGDFPSWIMNFDISAARTIKSRWGGKADLIVANNVLAHIDDLDKVFEGIDYLLAEDGHLVVEFQYFHDMVQNGLYDGIYHEHHDQHTLKPWVKILKKHNLEIKNYEAIPNHGGSIRMHCARLSGALGFFEGPIPWEYYKGKITENQLNLIQKLPSKFCIWGATAKATTLIHQLGIGQCIEYCVDNTPAKKGLYIPGTAIEIIEEFKDDELPVLLTAWNYEDEFKKQYPERGYITPYE